jgi:hypothetical protein
MLTTSPSAPKLILLTLPIVLAQFAKLAVEYRACQAVASLASIELSQRAPALVFVVNHYCDPIYNQL